VSERTLEEIERLLEGADVDEALRAAVALLAAETSVDWAAIAFLESGQLVLGPQAGAPDEARRTSTPISFRGDRVGELLVDGSADPAFLERVAGALSAAVLLGWDTGGEAWEP
jgi:hypothetical protein